MATISDIIGEFTLNSKDIGINLLIAVIVLVLGILLGKLVKLILRVVAQRLKLEKIFRFGSIDAFLTIIKWTVYIFFITLAIDQLSIPLLNTSFFDALDIVPKSVGALVIIATGFSLGLFLKKTIIKTEQKDWQPLGEIAFYLFLYLSFIISVQLVFDNDFMVRWIILLFTGFYLLFLTLKHTKVLK